MAMSIASSMPCASTRSRKCVNASSPPSSGATRVVAAVRGADGVRGPDVARRRLERVVAALAVRVADGMDRQHVQDVESHLRDVRDAPLGLGERRGRRPLRIATLRAGEELVPGAEPGALAVDHERQLRGPRAGTAVGVASHAGQQVLADEGRRTGGLRARPAHRGERLPHERGRRPPPPPPRPASSAPSTRIRPSSSSFGTGTDASSFLRSPSRHEPNASRHASMA